MSCCDYQCNQGRDCPVRSQPANNQVATLRPLYRRCDVMGVCQSPDAECKANCLLHDAVTRVPAPYQEIQRQINGGDVGLDYVAMLLVVTGVMATLAFCLALYAEQLGDGLLWLAEAVTRLVARFAAWPLGWN